MKKVLLAAVLLALALTARAAPTGEQPLSAAVAQGSSIARPTAQTAVFSIERALQALDRCARLADVAEFGAACGEGRTAKCSAYFKLYLAWLAQATSASRKAVESLGKLTVTDLALSRPVYDQLVEKIGGGASRDYKLGGDEAKLLTGAEEKQYVAMRLQLASLGDSLDRVFKLVQNQ